MKNPVLLITAACLLVTGVVLSSISIIENKSEAPKAIISDENIKNNTGRFHVTHKQTSVGGYINVWILRDATNEVDYLYVSNRGSSTGSIILLKEKE